MLIAYQGTETSNFHRGEKGLLQNQKCSVTEQVANSRFKSMDETFGILQFCNLIHFYVVA